jgi:hypothetical protein
MLKLIGPVVNIKTIFVEIRLGKVRAKFNICESGKKFESKFAQSFCKVDSFIVTEKNIPIIKQFSFQTK